MSWSKTTIQPSLAIMAWLNSLNFLNPVTHFCLGCRIKSHVFQPIDLPFPSTFSDISSPFFHTTNWKKPVYVEMDCVTQLPYHILINLIWIHMLQMKLCMQARGTSAVLQLASKIHRALFILFLLVIRNGLFGLVEVFVCQFSKF